MFCNCCSFLCLCVILCLCDSVHNEHLTNLSWVRVCDMLYGRNKERTGNDIGTFQIIVQSAYLLIPLWCRCSIVWNTSKE